MEFKNFGIDEMVDGRIDRKANDYFDVVIKTIIFINKYNNLTGSHIMLYVLSLFIKDLIKEEHFGVFKEEMACELDIDNQNEDVIDKFNLDYLDDEEMEKIRPKAKKIAKMTKARAERTYERFIKRLQLDTSYTKYELARSLGIPEYLLVFWEEI